MRIDEAYERNRSEDESAVRPTLCGTKNDIHIHIYILEQNRTE